MFWSNYVYKTLSVFNFVYVFIDNIYNETKSLDKLDYS